MSKKYILFLLLSHCFLFANAQQYGLFNTKTLFDSFENPAQKSFVLDSSRKFASNFFLPYFGLNVAQKGNSDFIRKITNERTLDRNLLLSSEGKQNTLYQNSNIYLLAFKVFQSHRYHKELGFAWQMRSDLQLDYTDESIALLDNFEQLRGVSEFPDNVLNNKGYGQTYHQFSFSYREDYNKQWAFGAKLSLLSGITYNELDIDRSSLTINGDQLKLSFSGSYSANFREINQISRRNLIPDFKNPGLSLSFGTTYKSKRGVFIMGNIKDLGFLKWHKNSYKSAINVTENIDITGKSADEVATEVAYLTTANEEYGGFYTLTNAKADFLISREFGLYKPSLIVSKNLFFKGGDAALVNEFRFNTLSLSAIPIYNFNNLFLFGAQFKHQTPNFEVFLGSDNLFKTYSQANGFRKKDANVGSGYNGGSFYMGVGIKFGRTVEHPLNSSFMPGVGDDQDRGGFFRRLFGRR